MSVVSASLMSPRTEVRDVDVLVDLRIVDLDLDDRLIDRELVPVEGDAVGKTGAEGDDAVALQAEFCRRRGAVHPHHAREQPVRGGEGAQPHQRGGDGRVQPLGERARFLCRFGGDDAAAHDDERTLRRGDRLGGGFHVLRRDGFSPDGDGRLRLIVRDVALDVFQDIDEDGSLPARIGDGERLADDARKVVDVLDDIVVLGDGQRDPEDVDLLEGVAP